MKSQTHYWQEESSAQFKYEVKYWGGALLIHVLLGLLLVGFSWRSQQAVVPQLAINAVLVDRNTLNQLARQKPAPPVEDNSKQQELEKQRQQQEQLKQEKLKQDQLKQEQLELQRVQDEQRRTAEAEKQKQVEVQRKAEQAEQKRKQQEVDQKRVAEIQQKQRDAELKRQADADAKAQTAKEAELKAQLAAEEGRASAVNAGLLNQWMAQIQQKVWMNWKRPASAQDDLQCELLVRQSPNGTVLSVRFAKCNADAAVRISIETAVYAAAPLPIAPDQRLFDGELRLPFKVKP